MQVNKLGSNILLFTTKSQKELAITFFRMQEHYESQNKKLFRKPFDVFTFLDEMMDKKGHINYFSYWAGFNFPDTNFEDWRNAIDQVTPYEQEFIKNVDDLIDVTHPYYLIGALKGDKETINHEISHALYYLNPAYREEAEILIYEMINLFPDEYKKIKKHLMKMGYNENVVWDEIQAYFGAEKLDYLADEFSVNFTKHSRIRKNPIKFSDLVNKQRKLLRKYNKFKW
jgi:hypothetical protein